MPKENSVIETGVDKLVEIVRAKRKISIQDAAKQLGVGPVVVEEWADFLEEEGIISIEYKFATPYLVERKSTKEEVKKKEKDFHSKKEGFIRKAEVTLAVLDRDTEDFQIFKNSFEKLKKDLGTDLVHVEAELKQLEKFENLKQNIDKEIMEQEKDFKAKINSYAGTINREQSKYEEVITGITKEEEKLDKERLETLSLREKEMQIKKKLDEFQENIEKINKAILEEESSIDNSEKRIKELKKTAVGIKSELVAKKDNSKRLQDESAFHKKKILGVQQQILEKVEKNKIKIDTQIAQGKVATKKFKEFFNKKVQVEKLIKEMDNDKYEMEKELIDLIKKAKAFHLSSNSSSLKSHIKELEKTFENIKKKKSKFESEAVKLGSLLKN